MEPTSARGIVCDLPRRQFGQFEIKKSVLVEGWSHKAGGLSGFHAIYCATLYYILSPFSRKLPAKEYEKRTGSECIVAIAHAYTCTPSYVNV